MPGGMRRTGGRGKEDGVAVIAPKDLTTEFAAGDKRLRGLLAGLTDEGVRAPSALPDWTRGHLLSHVEGVAHALARQAQSGLDGTLVDLYEGGRPARAAAIEAGCKRSAEELTAAVHAALDEAAAVWAAVGPDDWDKPVLYRGGVVFDAGLGWWRELEIHISDALLGGTSDDWSEPFCLHLLDYLGPRLPSDARVTLTATDRTWSATHGPDSGAPELAVQGRLTDLAAWLAGRTPQSPLTGDPLPVLGDWPSPLPR